jgi:hypothetical protein
MKAASTNESDWHPLIETGAGSGLETKRSSVEERE